MRGWTPWRVFEAGFSLYTQYSKKFHRKTWLPRVSGHIFLVYTQTTTKSSKNPPSSGYLIYIFRYIPTLVSMELPGLRRTWKQRKLQVFTPVSMNHVQGFPGGSGFSCREDMTVLWVSAICLRRRAITCSAGIWGVSKSAEHFKKDASGASGQACLSKNTCASFLDYIHRMFWNHPKPSHSNNIFILPTDEFLTYAI